MIWQVNDIVSRRHLTFLRKTKTIYTCRNAHLTLHTLLYQTLSIRANRRRVSFLLYETTWEVMLCIEVIYLFGFRIALRILLQTDGHTPDVWKKWRGSNMEYAKVTYRSNPTLRARTGSYMRRERSVQLQRLVNFGLAWSTAHQDESEPFWSFIFFKLLWIYIVMFNFKD